MRCLTLVRRAKKGTFVPQYLLFTLRRWWPQPLFSGGALTTSLRAFYALFTPPLFEWKRSRTSVRSSDVNSRTERMHELSWGRCVRQETRPCGISDVSERAFCSLSLRLDMRWGAIGYGRRRDRDDRDVLTWPGDRVVTDLSGVCAAAP
jgi:hypothetical protein